jgi:type VI secretion system secreted protein Hcp
MFLSVKGASYGRIKGESQDSEHKDEIEILSWSWGLQGRPDLARGATGVAGMSSIRDLRIMKRVDKASVALMKALRTNEKITEAVLTLRKAGNKPLEYLKITISDGRVSSLEMEAGDASGSATLIEKVSFTFNQVEVEYTPQGADGLGQASVTFADQWATR